MTKGKIRKNQFKYFESIIITFFWLIFFSSPLLLGQFEDQINWDHVFRKWFDYLPLFLLFFVNRFILLPKLFLRNKRLLYIIITSGLIFIMTTYSYVNEPSNRSNLNPNRIEQELGPNSPNHREKPPPANRSEMEKSPPPQGRSLPRPIPPYLSLFIFSVLIISFDTGIWVSFRLVETEREKAKLEKENVGTQLAFLRNQLNPHFFMNTLNNIHALVDINSEEAKESIIQLSKLMRHLLYDSEIQEIPVHKEFEFIQSYVDLMKLRFSDKVKINLVFPEQIPEKSIPPLLFTSFVENAFKHGISYEHSSFIDIVFSFSSKNLTFEIKNSNLSVQDEYEPSGIGIENSQKRLALIYGDNYSLKIDDTKKEYFVQLTIPI